MERDILQTGPAKSARRLCNEIQLFDLCDLDRCAFKDGRFCTREDLLARFEQLPDEDDQAAQPSGHVRDDGELDDDDLLCGDEDDFEDLVGGFDPEEDEWQE
jgi:hypothetical protein